MFATLTLLTLVHSVSGTPYISGGDSPRGTDCSALVSWVTNAATGRPIYGNRFNTGNIEKALLARGFQYGSQPGALNVGWNGGHRRGAVGTAARARIADAARRAGRPRHAGRPGAACVTGSEVLPQNHFYIRSATAMS